MSGKYLLRPMHERTRNAVTAVMRGDKFQLTSAIALKLERSTSSVDQLLRRLYDKGVVERQKETLEGGGIRYWWRAVPEGYTAPLYDVQPGVCGRALDECLGGFSTYRKVNEEQECRI